MIQSHPGTNNFSWIPSAPLKKQGLESYHVDQDFCHSCCVGSATSRPAAGRYSSENVVSFQRPVASDTSSRSGLAVSTSSLYESRPRVRLMATPRGHRQLHNVVRHNNLPPTTYCIFYEEVKQESLHKPEPMWDSRPC